MHEGERLAGALSSPSTSFNRLVVFSFFLFLFAFFFWVGRDGGVGWTVANFLFCLSASLPLFPSMAHPTILLY